MAKPSQVKDKCQRCGLCCMVAQFDDNNYLVGYKFCQWLIQYKDDKTRCAIYPHRIGAIIGKNQICGLRKDYPYRIPKCPYNNPERPPHPVFF